MPKNWDLQVDPDVFKILKKVPRQSSEVILRAIRFLLANPYFGDIQKMKGEENAWRRRIGSYRIFYKIKIAERIILVFHLQRRTSSTY
ncbi:MAG: type II toxin-antitoxin system RelE/ParE family toxin [Candidatus Harrisonbacteria bacterium]|nr:type II toxin-antitoxin system RelE/ParE family toxin [Candidatus Harrisonbacteria bacterium]